jgi:hypothetical protein
MYPNIYPAGIPGYLENRINFVIFGNMKEQRVILVDGARLLREVLRRQIDKVDGLQVVMELEHVAQLNNSVEQLHPDWVIVMLPSVDEIPAKLEDLLWDHTGIRIMAVSPQQRVIRTQWLERHDESQSDLPWDAVIALLKQDRHDVAIDDEDGRK